MESNKSFFTSFKRTFKSSSSRRDNRPPVSKRKDGGSLVRTGLVFPEDNAEKRYEAISDFTQQHQEDGRRIVHKSTRKPKHTLSERSRKERPDRPSIRSPKHHHDHDQPPVNNKSATLPTGIKPPSSHTIRIPPPRHTRKPIPLSPDHYTSPTSTALSSIRCSRHTGNASAGSSNQQHCYYPPLPSPLPHTMSSIDFNNSQYKTPVNISKTGPTTLPHEYSEPFHWLTTDYHHYTSILPGKGRRTRLCSEYDDRNSADHKYANLQVSASMVELRSEQHEYMEINKSTLNRPIVPSDYQQPIALRRLPGPPTAVKERQQRRQDTKILRGTIVVLDENKTLEV